MTIDPQKHRVLVIGTGSIGERHARCFLKTGRARVSIVETNSALRDEVGRRYEILERYESVERALEHPWDLAVVATPAPTHVPIANQVAARGIHMLIEKPLAIHLEDVRPLMERLGQGDRVVGVGYVWRVHPVLTRMREAIRSGEFGQAVQIRVESGSNFPHFRPAYREIYYASHEQGGGAIQDALTHLINAGEWLVGPVTRISADAAHKVLPGVEVEDTVHAIARHTNVMGAYVMNQHQAPTETTFTVICTHGTVRMEQHANRWMSMKTPDGAWQIETLPPMQRDDWFTAQAKAFLDAIERKRKVPCTLAEAFQTLKATLAAMASWKAGSAPQKINS